MHQQEDEGGGASEVVELLRLEVVCSHKGDPLHGEADGSRTQKRLHVSHLCFRGVYSSPRDSTAKRSKCI